MKSPQFTLKDLEMLVAVHQSGSLAQAARQVQCTPSALSHRVQDLELKIGFPLTERHGTLQLSARALRLIPQAEQILALAARLDHDLSIQTTPYRIGVSRLLLQGPYLLALHEYISRDAAEFEIHSGHSRGVEDMVLEERVDVGLVRLEQSRPGLRYQLIEEDPLVAVSKHPLQEEQVAQQPWVLFSSHMGHGAAINRALKEAGVAIHPTVVADSLALALSLVQWGQDWVTVLPWSVAGPLINTGQLVVLKIPRVIWPTRRNALIAKADFPAWSDSLIRTIHRHLAPTDPC